MQLLSRSLLPAVRLRLFDKAAMMTVASSLILRGARWKWSKISIISMVAVITMYIVTTSALRHYSASELYTVCSSQK